MSLPTIRLRFSPDTPKLRARISPAVPPKQPYFRNNGTAVQWRIGLNGDWTDLVQNSDLSLSPAQILAAIDGNFLEIAHNLSDVTDTDTARLNLAAPTYRNTRTAMKLLDPTKDTVVVLTEAGRNGLFFWMAGDYSAQVAIDTLEGMYVKVTAIAATVGVYMRISGVMNPVHFGADPTHTTDSSPAIKCARDLLQTNSDFRGGRIELPAGHFKCNSEIDFTSYDSVHNITITGAGLLATTLDFSGAPGGSKGIVFGVGADIWLSDFMIDGAPNDGLVLDGGVGSVSYFSVRRIRVQNCGATGIRITNAFQGTVQGNFCKSNVDGIVADGFNTTLTITQNECANNSNSGYSFNGLVGFDIRGNGSDTNVYGYVGQNLRGGCFAGNYTEGNTRDAWLLRTSDALSSGKLAACQDIKAVSFIGNFNYASGTLTPGSYASFLRLSTLDGRGIEIEVKGNESIRANIADYAIIADGTSGAITIWEEANNFDGGWSTSGTVNRRTGYAAGGTDVAVADGGTGASTASGARTNLGVVIGTDVAPVASPTFTGVPAGPTAAASTSTTQLATTAFATTADNLKANLASPTFTGTPAAPTPAANDNSTKLATTAYVDTADALKANLASPALTGNPTAPTQSAGNNSTRIASTAYVDTLGALKANLASPTFTGAPALAAATATTLGLGTFSSSGATRGSVIDSTTFSHSGTGTAAEFVGLFYNANGLVGNINTSGSATIYATSSDYRLKIDVEPLVTFSLDAGTFESLPDALRLIMAAQPVAYRWKTDPEGPISHGFIAHELQQVFPHAVTGEKDAVESVGNAVFASWEDSDTGQKHSERRIGVPERMTPAGWTWTKTGEQILPQGVDYSKLVADLTAAVQALTVIVLEQKGRLDEIAAPA